MAGEPISSNYLQFTTNTSKNQGGVTLADFKELKKLDCREVARREGLEPNRQEKIRCFLHTGDNTPSLQLYRNTVDSLNVLSRQRYKSGQIKLKALWL